MLSLSTFIELRAGARYWDDAKLNGENDVDGKIPFRQDDYWCPIIDLSTGTVVGWPEGLTASIHYKVCDDGEYWLLNRDMERIAQWADYYVPNSILCVNDNGYGDYIIFTIQENGTIAHWKEPTLIESEWNLI